MKHEPDQELSSMQVGLHCPSNVSVDKPVPTTVITAHAIAKVNIAIYSLFVPRCSFFLDAIYHSTRPYIAICLLMTSWFDYKIIKYDRISKEYFVTFFIDPLLLRL